MLKKVVDQYADRVITEDDLWYFKEGSNSELYKKMGAHPCVKDGVVGTYFAVWAPNTQYVSVIGDFNEWDNDANKMEPLGDSGIHAVFVPGATHENYYKFHIVSNYNNYRVDKADPFAFYAEVPPGNASRIWYQDYQWNDESWMNERKNKNALESPWSVYEVHPGSWKRVVEQGNRMMNYRELAVDLAKYASEMGFTHVELLPVMHHPFLGSWGYQVLGFYSPATFYGSPADLKFFVDHMHQNGIGVILDWVPSHFPTDEHGMGYFDGTHLYEHEDSRRGFHPDWGSFIFDYGRPEVQSFLLSSAHFWLDQYHIDGIRVDAVASMLYLDYSRKDGEWIANRYGGNENLEAIQFLQNLNETIYSRFPDVQTIAEESTAWPGVSKPVYMGGLGFGMKWDMGWMHDTLDYFSRDPLHRRYHQNQLTFRMMYAFSENFMLSLSHDEVVHGKGSLLGKMPGDEWQKFANLRLLYAYMFTQPGKKLLFMGGEFGQGQEWSEERSLDWNLLDYPPHAGIQRLVRDLNHTYSSKQAFHELDTNENGFAWIDANDWEQSILAYIRKGKSEQDRILCIFNFTPVPRHQYRIGAPLKGQWKEILNSDGHDYGGSDVGNPGSVFSEPVPYHGYEFSLELNLPPLGAVFLEYIA